MSYIRAQRAQCVFSPCVYFAHFVGDLLAVSCNFENAFICGYTTTFVNTFSWKRIDVTVLHYMSNSRDGTNTAVGLMLIFCSLYTSFIYLMFVKCMRYKFRKI